MQRFQDICNFQKKWSLFIRPFSVKIHALQCLMSVFENFQKLIHMFQWYIMNLNIQKNLIFLTPIIVFKHEKLNTCYTCYGLC
jgi:hypothetical protein